MNCGILKSDVFKFCRAQVPLQPYFDQCVFDTCGCNVGGDCECLCTAVAAYAQACQEAGVHVKWRTQDACGMYRIVSNMQYANMILNSSNDTISFFSNAM